MSSNPAASAIEALKIGAPLSGLAHVDLITGPSKKCGIEPEFWVNIL
jgi:hypothetical protein